MVDKRSKTISYRRALWVSKDKKDKNLELLIEQAHQKLKKVKQRRFKRPDGQFIQSIAHKKTASGTFLHIVSETPGDHASTLPTDGLDGPGIDVDTSPPPPKREFMDGDILAFVKVNHVCICATGLRDASLTLYCQQLFDAAALGEEASMFDLVHVADADKIKLIEAQGVKSIDVKATLYDASVKYAKRKAAVPKAIAAAGKHLASIFADDPKEQVPDNISVTLELTTDDRMAKGRALGASRMKEIAKQVVEADSADEYVIVTRQNQRISQSEVYMKRKVDLDRHGKSVAREKAWVALQDFYKLLVKSGAVKQ